MANRYQTENGIVGSEELEYDNELQPHLGPLQFNSESFTPFQFDNPALDASDDPPQPKIDSRPNMGSEVKSNSDQGQGGNISSHVPKKNNQRTNEPTVTILTNQNGNATVQSAPVQFNNPSASAGNVQNNGRTNKDRRVIQTANLNEPLRWRDMERQRPLRQQHILLLKVFGIIACVFFFPTGIPALYYAFKTEKEFNEGIMRLNIDEAQRCARKSERLIIFSGLLAILTAVIIFAVVERSLMDESNYWDSTSNNRVLPP